MSRKAVTMKRERRRRKRKKMRWMWRRARKIQTQSLMKKVTDDFMTLFFSLTVVYYSTVWPLEGALGL